MKRAAAVICLLAMTACIFVPGTGFTEDRDTIRLAKSIYALARGESYETKLAIGTVVMNRVDDPWFGETIGEVLAGKHDFPAGSRYDAESLSAAHEVLSGRRVLAEEALYYQAVDAHDAWDADDAVQTVGGYRFFAENHDV